MATQHYKINTSTHEGAEMDNCLRQLAAAWDRFTRLRGVILESKDGTWGGDPLVFTPASSGNDAFETAAMRFDGVDLDAKKATAAASFGQIDSAFGNGNAAITQMLNRHL